jgi:hypothetical protein
MFDHLKITNYSKKLHEVVVGKHFAVDIIAKKILNVGY